MSVADPAQRRDAQHERDGKAAVHQAVVDEHVSEAEQRHSGARSDCHDREKTVQVTPDHDERGGDRGVGRREGVVGLEAAGATRVMRAVDAPEAVVPQSPVQEARPGLHRGSHDERHERTQQDALRGHAASTRVRKGTRKRTHADRKRSSDSVSCIPTAR